MRGRHVLTAMAFMAALVTALPDTANAQFSPQGILGAMTRPFRSMLGRFGHFPHRHGQPSRAETGGAAAPADAANLGESGPALWPQAYEDVLGYTFWPGDYARELRGRGFDVIADTLTQPPTRQRSVQVATTGSAGAGEADKSGNGPCDDPADTTVTWPITKIDQAGELTGRQHEALGKLQTAMAQALRTVKASCTDTSSLGPRERLHVLVQRLWVVRDAGIYVRAPLKEFYDSLTDEQKAKFKADQVASNSPQAAKAGDANSSDADAAAVKQQLQACAAQNGRSAEQLTKSISQKIRPSKQQAAGLQALGKTAGDMAKLLTASCATPIPADPLARLDAANNELTNMNYAATTMEIALNGFYAQLSAQQKAQFNNLGR